MVRELYADVNLPELVQRLLVVMHEVGAVNCVLVLYAG